MTATAHALIGTMIAVRFTDPFAAVPIALFSHYATDLIPHWDSATNWREKGENRFIFEAIADFVVSLILSSVVYYFFFGLTDFRYLYIIVFFSLLPDLITFTTRFLFKKKNPLWNWNNRLQSKLNKKLQLPWGIFTQIIAVGVVYLFLFSIFI